MIFIFHRQVLLVAGGFKAEGSTEILVSGYTLWTEIEPLPSTLDSVQAVSLDNQIICTALVCTNICTSIDKKLELDPNTGGRDDYTSDTILKFDQTALSWVQVGQLSVATYNHGASVVKAEQGC